MTEPGNGTLSGSAPNLRYLPDVDFVGSDDFTFVAEDQDSSSDPATVSITVENGTVRYVEAATGDNEDDGLTWDTALATLGEALSRSDFGGGDEIFLGAGTYTELVEINQQGITIHGAGRDETTVDGALAGTVIWVQSSAVATLRDMTVTGGSTESTGGGVANEGTLTLERMTISGNTARAAGGIGNDGNLVLEDVWVLDNNATDGGSAGMYNGIGALTMRRCVIAGNYATGMAGALSNSGTLTAEDTLIDDNHSDSVINGVMNNGGTATFIRSTISNNTPGPGGGAGDYGGAFHNQGGGLLSLVNCTVYGKDSNAYGALFVQPISASVVTLTHTTVYDNDSPGAALYAYGGTVVFDHTIMGGSSGGNCVIEASATNTSNGYNLDDGSSCGFDSLGDLSNANPALGALQDNGGLTPTALPTEAGDAVDGGAANACAAAEDQRGISRPRDGDGDGDSQCDIGAVEAE
jgi:hypothetical protein